MTEQDKALHKALIKILNDGSFELKAREIQAFLNVYNWVVDLPKLIDKKDKDACKRSKARRNTKQGNNKPA